MEPNKIQPPYIKLREKPAQELSGSPLAIIEALQKLDGQAPYKQLREGTKLSLSALYSLVKQLKAAQMVDVVTNSNL